ncbi:protocadherin beta-13-like [Gigantopelta aegis]|uniref:protocadherin beta-13-like n=1 Tax=Gigantopelta aegis TaxID=1735272 RepID=UPI001B88CAA9|nr:protocadherin beta-13-like [Gigantopelta aegis]
MISSRLAFFGVVFYLVSVDAIKLTYHIKEEQPNATLIGNIANDSNLRDFVSDEEFTRIQYSFLSQGNPYTQLFTVRNDTADLLVAKRIDRDVLCSFLETCLISIECVAKSNIGSFFLKIQLEIIVVDINDNSPEFVSDSAKLDISEGTPVGEEFSLPSAVDRDADVSYSVQSYQLISLDSGNNPFVLKTSVGKDNKVAVAIQLKDALDRETVDSYNFTLLAKDGGQPPKNGTLSLTVTVADLNDNYPVFEHAAYAVNISENTTASSVIVHLSATDKDIGPNGIVSYHFAARQPGSVLKLFELNPKTGNLHVKQSLEHEAGKSLTLQVEARDQGRPSKTSVTEVEVSVFDTHNDPPEIHINVFSSSGMAEISEFSEIGRVVAHIAVQDPDSGVNGIVQCSLTAEHFQLRGLDVDEYKVILVKLVDRESSDRHNVTVSCQDKGHPPIRVSANFIVKVLDENDNPPRFPLSTYYASIEENKPKGHIITQVKATDSDSGDNARISYSLLGNAGFQFVVDNEGRLKSNRSFDREEYSQIVAKVLAVDHGSVRLTATATVIITIKDVNDNPPVFSESIFYMSVPEGSPLGTPVGRLNASDGDENENAILMFQRDPFTDPKMPFVVYADGAVKTGDNLDRELQSRYEFRVEVADLGKPPLTSTARVVITVDDVNDHDPFIVFPNSSNNTISIPHTLAINTAFTEIVAYDLDDGLNQKLLFYVEGGNGSKLFRIGPTSGIIFVDAPFKESDINIYNLVVVTRDQGSPQRASQVELYIDVYYGNATMSPAPWHSSVNIITAFVLVGVTLLLGVAVVSAICLMRRNDRQRRNYSAKAEEQKVIANMKLYEGNRASLAKTSSDRLSDTDSEKKKKEVSFSLDEDNNISLSSSGFERGTETTDSLFTIPEDPSHEQSNKSGHRMGGNPFTSFQVHSSKDFVTNFRVNDDSGSDLSGDVSVSDSGKGCSDVEIQSHGGSSNVMENPDPCPSVPQKYHQPAYQQCKSSPVSFSTFYGSSPSPSLVISDVSTAPNVPKHRPSSQCLNSDSHKSAAPNYSVLHQNYLNAQRQNSSYRPHPRDPSYPNRDINGTYVKLKSHPHESEYMDMATPRVSGNCYHDDTTSEMTSAWDDATTTTSGSYTVDADELCDEIDKLFFSQCQDVIV